jgi:transcriptional regulator with XRE-family HTH domain
MVRDFLSIADRVRWAVGRSHRSLQSIAEEIGCTHATLSQWQTGSTNVADAKVGLVSAFAKSTGVHLEWLLSGDGPCLASDTAPEHELLLRARHIVEDLPAMADTASRLLLALEAQPPA